MSNALKQSTLSSLNLHGVECLTDLSEHSFKDSDDGLELHDINFVKNYCRGKAIVVAEFSSKVKPRNFSLVFQAIPFLPTRKSRRVALKGKGHHWTSHGKRNDKFVFIGITHIVQSPKISIPSSVWFSLDHYGKDVCWYVSRSTVPLNSPKHFATGFPKWEMSIPPFSAIRLSRSKSSMVKSGTQIIKNIEHNAGNFYGHELNKLNFKHLLASLMIRLDIGLTWVSLNESIACPYQLKNASIRMVNTVS